MRGVVDWLLLGCGEILGVGTEVWGKMGVGIWGSLTCGVGGFGEWRDCWFGIGSGCGCCGRALGWLVCNRSWNVGLGDAWDLW